MTVIARQLALAVVAATLLVAAFLWFRPPPPVRPLPPRLPRLGEFVTEVPAVSVRDVGDDLPPGELVLGVVVNGQARAYPLSQLTDVPVRKVLNDTLGGRAIAATWCDSCHNGIVYARDLEGRPLTLRIGNRLVKYSMVMIDRETESEWVHHGGEADKGPLKGKKLEVIPSVLTDWATWRTMAPDGTVGLFERGGGSTNRAHYERWPLQTWLLGLAEGTKAKAWAFDRLDRETVVNDTFAARPVVAIFDRPSKTARAFERSLGGRVLTFALADGQIVDKETGSQWDGLSGRASAGSLAGQTLTPLAGLVSTGAAWKLFHPESE